MKQTTTDICPDNNTLAAFAEGHLLAEEHEKLFLHIAGCPRCRDLCAFAARESAKEKTGKRIRIAERTRTGILGRIAELRRNEAARRTAWETLFKWIEPVFDQLEHAEVIAAGENNAIIEFASDPDVSGKKWRMQLFIPNQLEKDLDIAVTVPESKKIDGRLIFCGNILDIRLGKGSIAYEALRKSFDKPEVAFVFEDGETVTGYPVI